MIKHFYGSIAFTAAAALGATAYAGVNGLIVVTALGLLEISLSMDNAVVNARVLGDMRAVWRTRFLTWGMLIAVFGMRLTFPLAVVSASAWISPIAALRMALWFPDNYAAVLSGAHIQITGFGGAFLSMLFFQYFMDGDKAVHWIGPIERGMSRCGHINEIAAACTVIVLLAVSLTMPDADTAILLIHCGLAGMVSYILAEGVGDFIGGGDETARAVARAGFAGFLYLEVQDASFSFDGVVGALAVSNNLVLVALGLGIGAMFVRSITLVLVERGTLKEMPYLEHGAFWAVGAMAAMMFVKLHVDIPDVVTGIAMASVIGAALASSFVHARGSRPATSNQQIESAPRSAR